MTFNRVSYIAFLTGLASIASTAPASEPTYSVRPDQRELFLDDVGIAEMENLKRSMHQPDKKGAVIRPDPQMGEDIIQIRTAPIWDPQAKVYKLWDLYGPLPGTNGYYESRDGLHWQRPRVGQVEYRGSRDNNYISLQTPKGPRPVTMVVYDAKDPDPGRRFKSFLPNIGFAISADGIAWEMTDTKAVASSDNFSLSFDTEQHEFLATVKTGGPHGRAFALSTSTDFANWSEPKLAFHADDLDQQIGLRRIKERFSNPNFHQPLYNIPATYNIDIYMFSVFRYESMYIGMPALYHQTGKVPPNWPGFTMLPIAEEMMVHYRRDGDWAGFHDVQLASSRDLHQWNRLGDREPFIGSSPLGAGAYDCANIKPPSTVIIRDNELWMYYTGAKTYGPVLDIPAHRQFGAVCLAVLRRDGFVSLDAGEQPGTVITRVFQLPGKQLLVNVDALNGELGVELLDAQGRIIAHSKSLSGDLLEQPVEWAKGDLAQHADQPVSLRFTGRNVQFYSYWIE